MALNVELRGLRQHQGRVEVLHGLDLALGTGVWGLVGPNGAGKTTLLQTLATSSRPSAGSMRLLGYELADPRQKRAFRQKLGYLPQQMGYYPHFTVWEFVEYFALLKEMPSPVINRAVAQALERVGLQGQAGKKLGTLSGGQLRCVGLAQAIVNEPQLLLLDEPTAGLDVEARLAFRELLQALGAVGTVLIATHLVEDVNTTCSTVIVLSAGQIVFQGTPEALAHLGDNHDLAASPLERGYMHVLAQARLNGPSTIQLGIASP